MKKDAANKAATVNRLSKGGMKDKAMALYIGVKNAGQGNAALRAERKHEKMRRVRFGDNLTAQRVNKRDWKKRK